VPVRRDQDQPALLERAREPGFTPGKRDIAPLLDALVAGGSDEIERTAERALLRRPDAAAGAALDRLDRLAADEVGPRSRLARLLGRLAASAGEADRADAADRLASLLEDPSPRVRRQAALALGRFGAGAALIAAWSREREAPVLRALAEALGKVGGAPALAALERAEMRGLDPELDRILDRAQLTASRTLSRGGASSIDPDAVPPAPLPLVLRCRAGLERLLADEASAAGWPIACVASGRVETALAGPLRSVFALRLHHRFGFSIPAAQGPALAIISASAVFAAFTRGAVRYRIGWEQGGHRRAEVWRIAREVTARRPDLVNDPTDSTWQVDIGDHAIELSPRRLDDPRFAYRVADVPASSHPTVAAALARLAVAHSLDPAADAVWDPFVGSGLELIERARLAPSRRLVGSDIEPSALAAARANLDSAGVSAELARGDVLTWRPGRVTAILSNPPMGRRVARGRAAELLLGLVDVAGKALAPGGVLTWISPHPGQTRAAASRSGLRLLAAETLDMGGFAAEIQVFRTDRR
jgi:hypothetical protein